ncbi:MAG: serine/threonine protein kinase [Gemmatimonadales bacterium]
MQDATMHETKAREAAQVFGPSRWWSAAARQRFIEAMEPALALRHPNLVSTLAVHERGDTVVIVTESVTGVTLESVLAAEPVQSIHAIASILTQVATALDHAHAAGVAHGAICSSSVIIDENGDAIVADTGVAAAIAAAGVHGDFGDAASPAYASPELLRGERPSPDSDQYALGALAYEMLAGRGPLDTSAGWLRRMQLRLHPDSMEFSSMDVPEEWSRAVKRMLEKRPGNRFPSIADAVRVFVRAGDDQDQRFRGPLGWIVKQQLSGAMPLEDDARDSEAAASPFASIDAPIVDLMEQRLRDAVRRQAPRIVSRAVTGRRRTLVIAAGVAVVGAVAWSRIPPSTAARLRTTAELEMSQIGSPRTPGSAMTAAPPADFASDPVPAARQPTESLPPEPHGAAVTPTPPVAHRAVVTPPPPVAHRAAVARPQRRPKIIAPTSPSPGQSAATHTLNVEARPRPVIESSKPNAPSQPPVTVDATPIGGLPAAPPAASAASSSSSQASSPPSTVPPASVPAPAPARAPAPASAVPASPAVLSATAASTAARQVVDQIRTSSVHALSASMVSSRINEAFLDWLDRRPVNLEVGTPSAPRVTPTPDGGAQVRYVLPITWTHASGARPTRAATVVATVRPSADGATLVSWTLAQPFQP